MLPELSSTSITSTAARHGGASVGRGVGAPATGSSGCIVGTAVGGGSLGEVGVGPAIGAQLRSANSVRQVLAVQSALSPNAYAE